VRDELKLNKTWKREFQDRCLKPLGHPSVVVNAREIHKRLLLDAGVPVHVFAARCGHDPAVLLRSYAKRTRLVGGAGATWPLAARAQQDERVRRIACGFKIAKPSAASRCQRLCPDP